MVRNLFKIDFTGRHTDTQEMMLFLLSRDKMSNGSREKPICKNELIDFGGH